MSNLKDFRINLRKYRKQKGYSQSDLASILGKNQSTITRYENGELSPDAKDISRICKALDIFEYQLFNSDKTIRNIKKSVNPFKTDTLYLYYFAYFSAKQVYGHGKFKLKIYEENGKCNIDFTDIKTGNIYLSGYVLADDNVAFCIFENNTESSPRLEVSELIINISNGINKLMIGSYVGTNNHYVPSIRKCVVSRENLEFDEKIEKLLEIAEDDKFHLAEDNVLYLTLSQPQDFEDNIDE